MSTSDNIIAAIEKTLADTLPQAFAPYIPHIASRIYWRLRADGHALREPGPTMEERGWGKPGHKLERSRK